MTDAQRKADIEIMIGKIPDDQFNAMTIHCKSLTDYNLIDQDDEFARPQEMAVDINDDKSEEEEPIYAADIEAPIEMVPGSTKPDDQSVQREEAKTVFSVHDVDSLWL